MQNASYRCGEFLIDSENRRFSRDEIEIVLEHKVFAVILQLLAKPAMLVTREDLLDAVWGHRFVTPSTLNRVIALARRAFGDDAQQPRHIETVYGAGYRYIGPVERLTNGSTDLEARFRPPPGARPPARVQALIGREGELGRIRALLGAHRGVTVLGTGGMGKTTCALEFARLDASSFPDGVWFFDLAPMKEAQQCLNALAAALSVHASAEAELLAKVSSLLCGRVALLLLDNCDRIAPAVGTMVHTLLRGAEHLKVLSTSQRPLGFVGEQLLRMPPLTMPEPADGAANATDLERIASTPAVTLLLERTREVQPGFALTAANVAQVVDICRRLDGMPLAIELAAARFAVLSADQVLNRLEQRFHFLSSDLAGRESRHWNLMVLLGWSYDLLSIAERRLLRWLAVFVQGWTVEAAIDVAAAIGFNSQMAVNLLSGLVNKSLVTVDTTLAPPRYRLLESVCEFALLRLATSGEEQQARDAHVAYFRRLAAATHADILSGRVRERLPQIIYEEANISCAIKHASSSAEGRVSAMAIAGSLTLYWRGRGNYKFALRLYELSLRGHEGDHSPEHVRALVGYTLIQWYTQMSDSSVAHELRAAAEAARALGSRWDEACARAYLALCFANDGKVGEADQAADAAFELAHVLDDELLLGLANLARGWIYLARGDDVEALAALITARGLGQDFHQHHFIEVYIGLVLLRLGRLEEAAQQLFTSLRTAVDYQNLRGMGGSMEGCGYLAARAGQFAIAAEHLGSAARIREQTGISLVSFWTESHRQAHETALRELGSETYQAHIRAGLSMCDGDAIKMTAATLKQIAAGAAKS